MTASDILAGLRRRGFAVSLSAADKVLVSPGATLDSDDRHAVLAVRDALAALLRKEQAFQRANDGVRGKRIEYVDDDGYAWVEVDRVDAAGKRWPGVSRSDVVGGLWE